jgi:hypothetical protein
MSEWDGLWGAVLGGFIGAFGTGAAQVWSFHKGTKTSRENVGQKAAAELLDVVPFCNEALRTLPYVDHAGAPLGYSERFSLAEPMHRRLSHAIFVLVPQLTSTDLAHRVRHFSDLCEHVSGSSVDQQDIHTAVRRVCSYGEHVGVCLSAYLDSRPLPSDELVRVSEDGRSVIGK